MLSVVKLTLQARTLCTNCISRLHHPLRMKTGIWPLITHPTLQKPLVLTRYLRVKPGAKQSLKPQYKWDKVPATCTIVYESGLKSYISALYLAVALVGVSTGTLVVLRWQQLLKNITFWDSVYLLGVLSIILVTLGIAYHFARSVIIRIYHDPDSGQFVAVRRTFFGQRRQIVYYPREVKLKHGGKFTNQDVNQSVEVKIQGQNYYLSAGGFSSPVYYNVHLGGDDGHKDFSKSFVSGPRF